MKNKVAALMLLRQPLYLERLVGGETASDENYIYPLFKMPQMHRLNMLTFIYPARKI